MYLLSSLCFGAMRGYAVVASPFAVRLPTQNPPGRLITSSRMQDCGFNLNNEKHRRDGSAKLFHSRARIRSCQAPGPGMDVLELSVARL